MDLEQFDRSYLLELFREFYAQVLRLKEEIESPRKAPPTDEELIEIAEAGGDEVFEMAGEGQPALTPERVRADIVSFMQKQTQAVLRRGEENEQKRFKEIQYVMAAVADEAFLTFNWNGKEYWNGNLLEEEFFHTHNAGERFFWNVEELIKTRDAARSEVAAAYLLALSLGFRGKYQDIEGEERLKYYRLQLFATLFHRNPGLSEETKLFPQSYAHVLKGHPSHLLPRLRPWLIAMGAVIAGYLAVAHLVWDKEAERVSSVIERIRDAKRAKSLQRPVQPVAAAPANAEPSADQKTGSLHTK